MEINDDAGVSGREVLLIDRRHEDALAWRGIGQCNDIMGAVQFEGPRFAVFQLGND